MLTIVYEIQYTHQYSSLHFVEEDQPTQDHLAYHGVLRVLLQIWINHNINAHVLIGLHHELWQLAKIKILSEYDDRLIIYLY